MFKLAELFLVAFEFPTYVILNIKKQQQQTEEIQFSTKHFQKKPSFISTVIMGMEFLLLF